MLEGIPGIVINGHQLTPVRRCSGLFNLFLSSKRCFWAGVHKCLTSYSEPETRTGNVELNNLQKQSETFSQSNSSDGNKK